MTAGRAMRCAHHLLGALATLVWDPILERAERRAEPTGPRSARGSARTSWEVTATGSTAVAQHRGSPAVASLPTAGRTGTPWPTAPAPTRAQGSGHPLHEPLRPGNSPPRR